jgi:glycosyltransferase involved in cell wall biosynthesis
MSCGVIQMNTAHYKLSIITSVLNAEKTLPATIESLFPLPEGAQWVFVDGGSVDSTRALVKGVEGNARFDVYPGTTLYEGFNRGGQIARGDYLMWMNAGDTLHSKENLKKLVSQIETNNSPDVYYFDAIHPKGGLFPIHSLNAMPFALPFTHQACAIKRTTFDKFNGYDVTTGKLADHELMIRMWLNDCTFEFIENLILIKCDNLTSTEDQLGMSLNSWHNVRNLYKKCRPEKLSDMDAAQLDKLLQVITKGWHEITTDMLGAV